MSNGFKKKVSKTCLKTITNQNATLEVFIILASRLRCPEFDSLSNLVSLASTKSIFNAIHYSSEPPKANQGA